MAYTYEKLSNMTVAELRGIADGIEHEATKGHSTMHKEKLLPALCIALGIDPHARHEAKGINKGKIKMEIRALRKERETALASHDKAKLQTIRGRIHNLKKMLRRAIV